MQAQSLGLEDHLEEEMTIYFYIRAWKIPWTEESGGLEVLASQRVRHNWATEHKQETEVKESWQEKSTWKSKEREPM